MISGWIQYLVTTVHITTCKQTQLFPWENSSMCITYVTYRCSAHNKDIDVLFYWGQNFLKTRKCSQLFLNRNDILQGKHSICSITA